MAAHRKARGLQNRSSEARAAKRPLPRTKANPALTWFPELGRASVCFGVGVAIAIAEAAGDRPRVRIHRRSSFSGKAGDRHRQRLFETVQDSDLSKFLAAFGQRRRLQISRAILSGANTHHELARVSGLAPGPLYHHIKTLERAGMLVMVERNRYDLTAFGRDLLLVATILIASAKRRNERGH